MAERHARYLCRTGRSIIKTWRAHEKIRKGSCICELRRAQTLNDLSPLLTKVAKCAPIVAQRNIVTHSRKMQSR